MNESPDTTKLNNRVKKRITEELSKGQTYDQIAQTLGISQDQLDAWLPELQDEIQAAVDHYKQQAKRKLTAAASEAIDHLMHAMHHSEEEEVRLEAAKVILQRVFEDREDDTEETTESDVKDVLANEFGFISED